MVLEVSTVLVEEGFVQFLFDHSLFIRWAGSNFVALLIYVDDAILASNYEDLIRDFKLSLINTFKLKDLGVLLFFLGLEMVRSPKGIFLSQRGHAPIIGGR